MASQAEPRAGLGWALPSPSPSPPHPPSPLSPFPFPLSPLPLPLLTQAGAEVLGQVDVQVASAGAHERQLGAADDLASGGEGTAD